jgi:hypothetical protein
MSAIQSRSATGIVADALIAEAATSPAERRLYLGRYLGLDLDALNDTLLGRSRDEIEIDGVSMATVRAGEAALIPYRVVAAADSGPNRGSQGFAARLRSEFANGAPSSERRVLLVLDADPVETVRSAAEDAAALPRLSWKSLTAAAAAAAAPEVFELAQVVAGDLAGRRAEFALLERFADFCDRTWASAAAAGAALDELGLYLSDPQAAADPDRLKRGATWRRNLVRWSGPSEDLERQLERKLGAGSPGLKKVLAAVGPFGLDFGAFTLADLEERVQEEPPRLRRPVQVRGALSAISSGNSLAIWLPAAGATIGVRATGDLDGSERLEIRWAGGEVDAAQLDGGAWAELAVGHEDWRFGWLVLVRGSVPVDGVAVACYCADGSWFPVESSLLVDADQSAFRVEEDEPAGLAVAARGAVLGPVALDVPPTGPDHPDEAVIAIAERQGERRPLPLLLLGEDVPEPAGGGGADGDGDGGDGEAGDDDAGGEEDGAARSLRAGEYPAQASPVHAYLTSMRENPDGGERDIRFNARASSDWPITIGGETFHFASQQVGRFDGLELERAILARPKTWAFTVSGTASEPRLGDDPVLERLSLTALDREAVNAFQVARERFFAALAAEGSVYALAAGVGNEEAVAYVAAYAELLASLPQSGRYQPEFDRCLLIDAIVDTASGDRLIAPTNPVTVAFYLAFAAAAAAWSSESAGAPLIADVTSIQLDFLLPLFMAGSTWFEVLPVPPFLWRRYQPIREQRVVPTDEARLIAERLNFFLTVHPAYADRRQTLSVTVSDPGTGTAIVEALRRFYRPDYAKDEFVKYSKPRLDIHLLTPTGDVPPAFEDVLAGGDSGDRVDPLLRSRVRISGRRLDQGPPFSHLMFVFRTPTERSPDPVPMDKRANSLYVGGLAASPGRAVEEGPNERRFSWGTFAAGRCGEIPGGRAGELLPVVVAATLQLVGGQPRELLQADVTRMPTTAVPLEFMPDEYRQSVWVVHLDHVLGLEAFAADGALPGRYLIDYEDVAGAPGLGGVTATARMEPYRDALTQALKDLERLDGDGLKRILNLLNSVSGRWALRLLRDSAEHIRERIGTVAAIAMLQDIDASFDRADGAGVLLPLDELFERLPQNGIPRPQSRSTDDLLYVWVPYVEGRPVLRGRLLEVKYRSRGGPELAEARQEIENTEDWLRGIFNGVGPGRLFRARDLADVLRSSASRGGAFGLSEELDRARFESVLERVASGDYDLEFAFWVGGERLVGDVISIELESDTAAVRSALPGAGEQAGVVRLGRQVLNALAAGERLTRPPGWELPQFSPPDEDAGSPAEPGAPGGGDGGEAAAQGELVTGVPAVANGESGEPAAASEEVRRLARELDAAVLKYGLELEPFQTGLAQVGPSVIRFRARPLGRQSLDGVSRRAADLGREIGAAEGVLVAQEPYYITIDVPRRERQLIRFSDYAHLLGEPEPGALKFLVGMAASGEVTVADLARLPHLLIAGATGSGKSVFLRSLMCSLLEQHGAMDLSILLVDPKQVDFLPFEDLPHLVDSRIIFDPADAVAALAELIDREIEKRRPVLKRAGVTSVIEYYEMGGTPQELPQIVIVVDEFADLASTLGRGERAEFMNLIQRYGQMTRAFGIYLVLATQRPSVQVITGDIKANLTARVALKVQASQDSTTILGHGGAESLRDKGDLLFEHGGSSERLQGFMVTPRDVAAAVSRWSRP